MPQSSQGPYVPHLPLALHAAHLHPLAFAWHCMGCWCTCAAALLVPAWHCMGCWCTCAAALLVPAWPPTPPDAHPASPPQVLLLDEITVDLDVLGRADLMEFLKDECEARGATVIYVRRWGKRVPSARVNLLLFASSPQFSGGSECALHGHGGALSGGMGGGKGSWLAVTVGGIGWRKGVEEGLLLEAGVQSKTLAPPW
jgi:hypothetical protein